MNTMDEMEMDFPQWVTACVCDRTGTIEVSGDFTLPDYQPEIRRLLTVTPTVLPPAKYVGAANVELNGTVDYSVLYVGGDGGLYSVPLSADYSMQIPLEQMGEVMATEGITVFATPVCESVGTRVSAPRKLNIRCRVRAHVCAYGKRMIEEQIRGTASPERIRRLLAEGRSMNAVGGMSDSIAISTELTGMSEDTRVISACAEPFVQSVRMEDGMATASGEVFLKLLVGRENGAVESVLRKLPFEGEIDLPEASADADCRVSATVTDLSVQVEEGRVLCSAEMLLEARSMRDFPFRYTADLYSTERECVCQTSEYALPVALKCENANLSQSERSDLAQWNLSEEVTVVDAWGSAQLSGCETVGDKYVLTGQSRYSLLCEKDGEYSVAEVELPLRYETDGCGYEPVGFDALARVISCRARTENGMLSLDAEVSVVADFIGRETITPVTSVEFGDGVARRENGMTVYYPTEGESLWEVAKKHHVSPEALNEKKGACLYYFF